MNNSDSTKKVEDDHHEDVELPGFRFHPTDEELVGFYLRRKVEKKQLRIELIKEAHIYKYDPWDLPKSSNVGDKEWYFFCKRGRKYRNSIRPNRVTGSGFWKATGIDRPVYSHGGEGHDCIGLKKTLVYYRGSAGKGTKTDWMMHEFRLPNSVTDNNNSSSNNIGQAKSAANQEAEIWTICRILKRNVSHRKYTPDWREMTAKSRAETSSSTVRSCNNVVTPECYINFGAPAVINYSNVEMKPGVATPYTNNSPQMCMDGAAGHDRLSSSISQLQPSTVSSSNFSNTDHVNDDHQFFADGSNWDELRSVVEFALDL